MATKTHGSTPRYTEENRGGLQITGEADEAVHQVMPFDVLAYMIRHGQILDARRLRALRFVDAHRLFVDFPGIGVFKTSVHAWR